jgi:hypothetical protein
MSFLHGWQSEKQLIIFVGAKAILCGCSKIIIHEMNHIVDYISEKYGSK